MTQRIRLAVRGLDDRAVIGALCCALTAANAIRMELDSWSEVRTAGVNAPKA